MVKGTRKLDFTKKQDYQNVPVQDKNNWPGSGVCMAETFWSKSREIFPCPVWIDWAEYGTGVKWETLDNVKVSFSLFFTLSYFLFFILFSLRCIFLSMKFTLRLYKWCLSISFVPNNHFQKKTRNISLLPLWTVSARQGPHPGQVLPYRYTTITPIPVLSIPGRLMEFPGSPRPFSLALSASHTNHQQDKDFCYSVNQWTWVQSTSKVNTSVGGGGGGHVPIG